MSNDRFLLIKAWSHSLWKDIHQLLDQLLAAELSHRIPVVYWGTHCLYNGAVLNNAFDLYFEPVSSYGIQDLMRADYTFYPPIWDCENLASDDPDKRTMAYRNAGELLESNANVVVCDYYTHLGQLQPLVKENHPCYGMSAVQAYRYLIRRYLRLKPDIQAEIQRFWLKNMVSSGPCLAVHVRGDLILDEDFIKREMNRAYHTKILKLRRRDEMNFNDTVLMHQVAVMKKIRKLRDPNKDYHKEIVRFLGKYNIEKIFLLTDSEAVVQEYRQKYGDRIVTCDCRRKTELDDDRFHYIDSHLTKRRKGIEVIKDTYLAAQCQFFLGNGYSNLSHAVTRLRDWSETNIRLLYWILDRSLLPEYAKKQAILYPQNEFLDPLHRTTFYASELLRGKKGRQGP